MASGKSRTLRISSVAAIATLALLALPNQARAVVSITVGVGQSTLSDASAAMSAAADSAITALGGKTATVVLAWVDNGSEYAFTGLSTKFAGGAKVYGIPGKYLFGPDGRDRKAIVYALAGEIQAAHSLVARTGSSSDAGAQVGTALKAIPTKATDGKLFIIVGDQNNPADREVTSGFLKAYGDNNAWVVGGSSGKVFADGKVVSTSILGILLYGEFDGRFGFEEGTTVATAQTALTSAKDPTKPPTFAIIFNCNGRYEKLGKAGLTDEYALFKQSIGAEVPFVGGYFLGEIGKKNLNATGYGTGGSFSIVNIFSRDVPPRDAGADSASGVDAVATGTADSAPSGGQSGVGGGAAGAGGAGTAGSGGGTGGSGGGATGAAGTRSGSGGSGGASGSTSAPGSSIKASTPNQADPGCSCRVGDGPVRAKGVGLAVALLLVAFRWSRRRRGGSIMMASSTPRSTKRSRSGRRQAGTGTGRRRGSTQGTHCEQSSRALAQSAWS